MRRTAIVFGAGLFCFLVFPRISSEGTQDGKNATVSDNVKIIQKGDAPMASGLVSSVLRDSVEANLTNEINVNDTKEVETNIDTATKPVVVEIKLKNLSNDDTKYIKKSETNIEELKKEIQLAEEDLAKKTKRLEEIKKRANSTRALSERAQDHLRSLIFALNSLQGSLIHSSKAAFETDWQLQLQTAMYNEARRKHARLSRELKMTIADYEKTKLAAQNAVASAKMAQKNAALIMSNVSTPVVRIRSNDAFLGDFGTKHSV